MATSRGLIWPEPAPVGTVWIDPDTGDIYRKEKGVLSVRLSTGQQPIGYFVPLPQNVVCVYFPDDWKRQ